MRVSIGQIASTEDKVANLAAITSSAERAATDGSALLVLPEVSMYFRHEVDSLWGENAETIPGPFTTAVDEVAARWRIAIAVGMLEKIPADDRAHNTIYVTSSEGKQIGVYRKVHLYDAFGFRESDVIAPSGDPGSLLFDLNGIRFGVITCYDLRFPESSRALVDEGADVILLPSAWTPGVRKEDHWETLVRARAIENTVFVVAANQAVPQSTGGSLVVDPMGIVLAQLVEGSETRTVELDEDRVSAVRLTNPCVANRRFRVERTADVGA